MKVPAGVAVVAILLGAAWLRVVGALVAVPIAAAVQLLVEELPFRRSMKLDRTVMELTTADWTAAH